MRGLIFLAFAIVGCSPVSDVNKSIARKCNADEALVEAHMAELNSSKEEVRRNIGDCIVIVGPETLKLIYSNDNWRAK